MIHEKIAAKLDMNNLFEDLRRDFHGLRGDVRKLHASITDLQNEILSFEARLVKSIGAITVGISVIVTLLLTLVMCALQY